MSMFTVGVFFVLAMLAPIAVERILRRINRREVPLPEGRLRCVAGIYCFNEVSANRHLAEVAMIGMGFDPEADPDTATALASYLAPHVEELIAQAKLLESDVLYL